MSKQLAFSHSSNDLLEPRIGGVALIGGIVGWPKHPNGEPLSLIASIPSDFIINATGIDLVPGLYTSIFSYYSESAYFLDEIAYHGSSEEIDCIRKGSTKVIQHPIGAADSQGTVIPPHRVELGSPTLDDKDCGSRIGGGPCLLQNEELNLQDMRFTLQLRSSDFPSKYSDIFGVSGAIGYLYLYPNEAKTGESRLFFSQTT